MSVWIFLGSAGDGNDDFELLESVPMVEGIVGTDASCELRLRDPMLTPQHARVLTRDGAWYVGGIAAAAQTRVNDVPTLPGQAVLLAVGDVVQMGTARFRFGAEPPQRQGVDANDEAAVLIYGDRLLEQGSPLGERIIEDRAPDAEWLGAEEEVEARTLVPVWRRGLLTSLEVREFSVRRLESILAGDAAAALERLSVSVATCGRGSERESVRALLQVIAKTRPPQLRELELGWVHGALDHPGVARDWQSVARRVPLQTRLVDAGQLAGTQRFTMLRTAPGWPAVGVTTRLPEVGHELFGNPQGQAGLAAPGAHFATRVGACAEFSRRTSRGDASFNVNGGSLRRSQRNLTHADLVEGPDFAFRFEESR